MPQTTGLPAGPTSTHRTQTTNYNCKRNAPGAPPRREGACCRLSGTSFSAPRGAGCLPLGALCLARTPSFAFPMPLTPLPSTKMPILCSKRPKMVVSDPKSAQKPRFCARKARKRRSRRQKAHKNPDFVLETPENRGPEPKKSTKTSILYSKRPKTGVSKGKSAQKPRFCARKARK